MSPSRTRTRRLFKNTTEEARPNEVTVHHHQQQDIDEDEMELDISKQNLEGIDDLLLSDESDRSSNLVVKNSKRNRKSCL